MGKPCGEPFVNQPGGQFSYGGCPLKKERITRYCNNCGVILSLAPWEARRGKVSYCSPSCQHEFMRGENSPYFKERIIKKCERCGAVYQARPREAEKRRFCGTRCGVLNAQQLRAEKPRKAPVSQTCEYCGHEYPVVIAAQIGKQRFCSVKCLGLSRRDPSLPAKIQFRNTHEYHLWRTAVFERDDFTCQECGQRGGHLNAHHVFHFNDFDEHRLEVWNGITLCVHCHAAHHPQQANGIIAVANAKNKKEEAPSSS